MTDPPKSLLGNTLRDIALECEGLDEAERFSLIAIAEEIDCLIVENERMKKNSSNLEKLSRKYFDVTGQSPEMSFWAWLNAMGCKETEEGLKELLDDNELWKEMENTEIA